MNGYTNQTERISFQVEILKCQGEKNNCRGKAAIDSVFDKIFFTLLYLDETLEFANPNNVGLKPTKDFDTFHS